MDYNGTSNVSPVRVSSVTDEALISDFISDFTDEALTGETFDVPL